MAGGLAAIFEQSSMAVKALSTLHRHGYRELDLYSPYQVSEAGPYLALRPGRVSRAVFCGGAAGAVAGYALQFVTSVFIYPHQIGGTALHAWPAFLPFTFEAGVLLASLTAFMATLVFSGLPRYHHPVFAIPGFDRVSRDRFLVVVEAGDPNFEAKAVRQLLQSLGGGAVHEY